MSAVKIHLEYAEAVAVEHYAEVLGVTTEDVAYAALHQLMLRANEPQVQHDIVHTRSSRHQSLPPWSDTKRVSNAPFGDEDEVPSLSRYF
jgi:hypothetical protein